MVSRVDTVCTTKPIMWVVMWHAPWKPLFTDQGEALLTYDISLSVSVTLMPKNALRMYVSVCVWERETAWVKCVHVCACADTSICSLSPCVLNFFSLPLMPICPHPFPHYPAPLHITPRLEPEILLRAKQDFMKIDSATDLEWVSAASVCMFCQALWFFIFFQLIFILLATFDIFSIKPLYLSAVFGNSELLLSTFLQSHWERLSTYWDGPHLPSAGDLIDVQ